MNTLEFIQNNKVITICRKVYGQDLLNLAAALYEGGVKLFPAGHLGFGYIKDIPGPISHVKFCATDGVTEDTWGEHLELGFVGAGISARLCDRECIASGDFAEITRRAKVFMEITHAHE